MKKFNKVLSVLLLPLLITSFKSYDNDEKENYYDFEINSVIKDTRNENYYTLNVTNNGDYFLTNRSSIYLLLEDQDFSIRADIVDSLSNFVVPNQSKNIYVKIDSIPEDYELKAVDIRNNFANAFDFEGYENLEIDRFVKNYDQQTNKTTITYFASLDDEVHAFAYSVSYSLNNQRVYQSSYVDSQIYYYNDSMSPYFTFDLTFDGNILESQISDFSLTLYPTYTSPLEEDETKLNEEDKIILIICAILGALTIVVIGLTIALVNKRCKELKEDK